MIDSNGPGRPDLDGQAAALASELWGLVRVVKAKALDDLAAGFPPDVVRAGLSARMDDWIGTNPDHLRESLRLAVRLALDGAFTHHQGEGDNACLS